MGLIIFNNLFKSVSNLTRGWICCVWVESVSEDSN